MVNTTDFMLRYLCPELPRAAHTPHVLQLMLTELDGWRSEKPGQQKTNVRKSASVQAFVHSASPTPLRPAETLDPDLAICEVFKEQLLHVLPRAELKDHIDLLRWLGMSPNLTEDLILHCAESMVQPARPNPTSVLPESLCRQSYELVEQLSHALEKRWKKQTQPPCKQDRFLNRLRELAIFRVATLRFTSQTNSALRQTSIEHMAAIKGKLALPACQNSASESYPIIHLLEPGDSSKFKTLCVDYPDQFMDQLKELAIFTRREDLPFAAIAYQLQSIATTAKELEIQGCPDRIWDFEELFSRKLRFNYGRAPYHLGPIIIFHYKSQSSQLQKLATAATSTVLRLSHCNYIPNNMDPSCSTHWWHNG